MIRTMGARYTSRSIALRGLSCDAGDGNALLRGCAAG
jgi:hypothetical protein